MVGVSGGRGKNAKAVREFKASGNKAMSAGGFQKAMRLYTRALDLDPGNAVLYSNRSAAHFNLRQFAESLEDAESAILCDSMWWKAYKRKGLSLIHMQRYEEAIEALEAGLAIVGKNAEMEKNLEFARACQEQAQNLYILPEANMMQLLESVPVFIVTDEVGQPFFITYEDGQQVCTFYFDQTDAISTLDWIKSENPDLGDSARVIHITLNQAFNLAQETQKQYYEETTRAAAEADLQSAAEAAAAKKTGAATIPAAPDQEESAAAQPDTPTDDSASKTGAEGAEGGEDEGLAKKAADDGIIDENAPLSFQFRPELRQVQIAVELLNKNPDPPVKPILRDPPSVKKAKAEAAAAAAESNTEETTDKPEETADKPEESADKPEEAAVKSETAADKPKETPENVEETSSSAENKDEKVADSAAAEDTNDDSQDAADAGGGPEEEVELTVDNFNGIPVFQAKGLTLLQNNKQLIPLFFSKWDLEKAWKQLAQSNTVDVPGECDIDVGTLEDVLRRMSESKTDEFESVFFVPSRESMTAINAKFPLDELSTTKPLKAAQTVKKAQFSRAKQIAARGGSKDEIRAAIREDLRLHAERQKMAEIIAQIERAKSGTGGDTAVGGGASASSRASTTV